MKKILTILLTAMVITIAGCSNNKEDNNTPSNAEENQNTEVQVDEDSKALVVYFTRLGNSDFDDNSDATSSASLYDTEDGLKGNTQIVAEFIQNNTQGDIIALETANQYPASYDDTIDVAQEEQSEDARPELTTSIDNMDEYNVVFVGYPNWWGDMPMPIYSFLEEYNLEGKTIIPFCTHGGSGFSNTVNTMQEMLLDATILDGFSVDGSSVLDAENDIIDWLSEINLLRN